MYRMLFYLDSSSLLPLTRCEWVDFPFHYLIVYQYLIYFTCSWQATTFLQHVNANEHILLHLMWILCCLVTDCNYVLTAFIAISISFVSGVIKSNMNDKDLDCFLFKCAYS